MKSGRLSIHFRKPASKSDLCCEIKAFANKIFQGSLDVLDLHCLICEIRRHKHMYGEYVSDQISPYRIVLIYCTISLLQWVFIDG